MTVIVAVSVICGCMPVRPNAPPQESTLPDRESARPAGSFSSPPATQFYVQYDVLRVEVPRGSVSRSETLWNHVDESALPFSRARRLHLNGFRVGLTDPYAWAPIERVLDSFGAVQAMKAGLSQADLLPFAIQIDPAGRDRTVLYFGQEDRLVGSSFADSVNMIRIEHDLNPDRLSELIVRLMPEIRRSNPRTTLAATDAGLREVPVYEGRVFTDLAVELHVPEGSIIVIGPSDRAGRKSLIGTEFLCNRRNGVEYEHLLFITPRVVTRHAGSHGVPPED